MGHLSIELKDKIVQSESQVLAFHFSLKINFVTSFLVFSLSTTFTMRLPELVLEFSLSVSFNAAYDFTSEFTTISDTGKGIYNLLVKCVDLAYS